MSQSIWFFAILMSKLIATQEYEPIDDIPIESYDQAARQENDMDLELLPRQHRSFSDTEDPKDNFFRSMRSFDDIEDVRPFAPYDNIPRPNGITPIYTELSSEDQVLNSRQKRHAQENESVKDILITLGKPLEVAPLSSANSTAREGNVEIAAKRNLSINDFIRFRRSVKETNYGFSQPKPEKMMMDDPDDEINRETRGATNEHWIKQPYPVRKTDELAFEDNMPSSSENIRFPRVHLDKNGAEDGSPDFRHNQREARSRGLNKDGPRDVDYYQSRPNRPLYPERPYYRDERYHRYDNRDRDVYRPRYEHYERPRSYYPSTPQKPQKRIIYYATLPEIPRSSPNSEIRDRYHYDRYDDRYSDPYRIRKGPLKSSNYEDGKTPYPVKVSTDVNVREVKKNPERIYSEVDRTRYAYNTPYQATVG
ncbi:uncharacterized protein LOC132695568 [Cylas formicarius]|uniref:uncharacterized protein LOC132695568 n=1 Tax=Cylas formicarius TaxID=197179 RepID=UPI0029588024|nr:uncharacterized protein LOC132695568 [Cylas formicarius]XP_060515864.1 uncharacterized protein LOC132695568 [Cylas formicarius]